jgi:hypothetical protein
MGIFGSIKGIIFRKKETEPIPEEPLETLTPLRPEREALEPIRETQTLEPTAKYSEKEIAEITNIRAKIDLLLTEIDSIKIQNRTIDERLRNIEKLMAEMKGIRYY